PTHLDLLFFFQQPRDHRPPHSFPTRRSSDLTKQSPLFSRPGANATNGRLFLDISIETVATGGFITNLFAHWTNWFVPAFQTWPADRKSTRLNSSHDQISYAVFCLKKKRRSSD